MEVSFQNVVYCDFSNEYTANNYISPESGESDSPEGVMMPMSVTSAGSQRDSPEQIDIKPDASAIMAFDQLPRNVCPTICVVCGDAAAGYHYDVPSCNGCKTFFRRCVLDQRKFVCKKGGRCFEQLPKEKRCACRACRFNRCVEVGMNPLAIQTNKSMDNNETFKMIVSKRKNESLNEQGPSNAKILIDLQAREYSYQKLMDELQFLEMKVNKIRSSKYNPRPHQVGSLREIVMTHSFLSQADKFEPMPDWPLSPPPPFVGDCKFTAPNRKMWFFFDLLISVEYAKTFPFFRELSQDDRFALTRVVSLMCCALSQSFSSYRLNTNRVIHPDGTSPWNFFKPHSLQNIIDPLHKVFEQNISSLRDITITMEEYVLLKVIVLCNSAVSNLSPEGSKIIEKARLRYAEALFSYEMATHGALQGPSRFQAILAIVETMIKNAVKQRETHLLRMIAAPPPRRNVFIEEIMDA